MGLFRMGTLLFVAPSCNRARLHSFILIAISSCCDSQLTVAPSCRLITRSGREIEPFTMNSGVASRAMFYRLSLSLRSRYE